MFTALADKIEILFPANDFDWNIFVTRRTRQAFSPDVISFLDGFSKDLLNDPRTITFPDLAALGFWLRAAQLRKMIGGYDGRTLIARGTVFHLAPGNVDTIFIYSMVLGLLTGNRNIVRLGKRRTPQQQLLLDIVIKALQKYPRVASQVLIVRYGHDDEITGFFGTEIFGDLNRLVNTDEGRNIRAVIKFEHRDPDNIAVHGGHSGNIPFVGNPADDIIDFRFMFTDAGNDFF